MQTNGLDNDLNNDFDDENMTIEIDENVPYNSFEL